MKALDSRGVEEAGAGSGALEQHLKLKLELAAVILSMMQLFHEAKDDGRE